MKIIKILNLIFVFTLINSCSGQERGNKISKMENTHKFTNELINESSPYLMQHAHNPVNWYPWGEKALEKAKAENKLVLISIGYAACHWCHVMEKESFENEEVAQFMNAHFINIKVDKEERPDVDQIYMNAAQLITGSGGWPLNALALPDGRPFFAGTYFPKKNWLSMLAYFTNIQIKEPQKILEQAQHITQGIINTEAVMFQSDSTISTIRDIHTIFNNWKAKIDFEKGGEMHAPKFPMPSNWEYLLQYYYLTKNEEALKAVSTTLNNMAFGGIYDHLEGGFARYATDINWKIPHFEKMLYDNAQLVSLYSHAYQATQNPLYQTIVEQTFAFIEAELSSQEDGFYTSLDADSEGEEGKYYVWTAQEIKTILGKDAPLFIDFYNVTDIGNWENGANILFRKVNEKEINKKFKLNEYEIQEKINDAKEALLKQRKKREKPRLDDKILTSWNALMIKGYIDAYRAFNNTLYKERALKNANFLINKLILNDGEIKRNYKNNKATINGLLDDYAFTISAFISIYQATFDEQWLYKAKSIADYTLAHFFDSKTGMFFYTNNQYQNLIAKKYEISDNVIPASNSEMAKNLFYLGLFFDSHNYTQKSKQMLINVQNQMHQNIRYYSNWGSLELMFITPPYEIAIVGQEFELIRKELQKYYLPNAIFLGAKNEGTLPLLKNKLIDNKTTIYVCQNKTCKLPTDKAEDAIKQIIN